MNWHHNTFLYITYIENYSTYIQADWLRIHQSHTCIHTSHTDIHEITILNTLFLNPYEPYINTDHTSSTSIHTCHTHMLRIAKLYTSLHDITSHHITYTNTSHTHIPTHTLHYAALHRFTGIPASGQPFIHTYTCYHDVALHNSTSRNILYICIQITQILT